MAKWLFRLMDRNSNKLFNSFMNTRTFYRNKIIDNADMYIRLAHFFCNSDKTKLL